MFIKNKRLLFLAQKSIITIFSLFVFLLLLANIFFTITSNNIGDGFIQYHFFPIISNVLTLLSLIYIKRKNFKFASKKLLIIFLVVGSLFSLFWVLSNPQGYSCYVDAYNVSRSAHAFMSGNPNVLGFKTYINTYPNNLGLFTVLCLLIKLFKNRADLIFRLLNIIFIILGYLYLYLLTKKLFKREEILKFLVILFIFTSQFFFLSYHVYGNAISYSLGIVATYYFLQYYENNNYIKALLAFLSLMFSIFIKNNSMIIMVAFVCYLVVKIISEKRYLNIAFIILLVVGAQLSTEGIIHYYEKKVDVSYHNRLPKICWVAYAFNYDSKYPGGYISDFEHFHFANDYVSEYTTIEAKRFIDDALRAFKNRPLLLPRFLAQKMLSAWAAPEFGVNSTLFALDPAMHPNLDRFYPSLTLDLVAGKSEKILIAFWDIGNNLVALGSLIYLIKRKEKSFIELLPATIIIGGFLFHCFWEIKSIYLYQYYLYLLPYASYGYYKLKRKETK